MSDRYRLIHGSAHHLPMIADGSVQSIITSPPYFGLRAYSGEQQIEWPAVEYAPLAGMPPLAVPAMTCALGHEPTIEAYIGHLILCLREWRRVLRDDGLCFVNLGDSFSGAGDRRGGKGDEHGQGKKWATPTFEGIPGKNMLAVPWRFALAAQADSWVLRRDLIWAKGISFCPTYSGSCMPESVQDRATSAHEYIFMLAKQPRYFYDAEAAKEKAQTLDQTARGGFAGYQATAQNRKPSGNQIPDKGRNYVRLSTRNLRSVWAISPQKYSAAHFAVWPEALVEPLIKCSTAPGDTVLDPFSGSGTTGRAAIKLGRAYIGVDISREYLEELAPDRLTVQMELLGA